jgi:hypothetical protein
MPPINDDDADRIVAWKAGESEATSTNPRFSMIFQEDETWTDA